MNANLRLAANWTVRRVRKCMRKRERTQLVQFLRERHHERFFGPILLLRNSSGNNHGYGFAMMALCSLLVETMQSYKDGLPTTFGPELEKLKNTKQVPSRYAIPPSLRVNGKKTFERFFRSHRPRFPKLSGSRFYKNIRNGLLHQGQTKAGWIITKQGTTVCDGRCKTIYRDRFSEELMNAFEDYLERLTKLPWTHRQWINASRKIWWLIRLSG